MKAPQEIDPGLAQLADAVLIPPFPGHEAPPWILAALGDGLAGVTLFGLNVGSPAQLAGLTATLRQGPRPPAWPSSMTCCRPSGARGSRCGCPWTEPGASFRPMPTSRSTALSRKR